MEDYANDEPTPAQVQVLLKNQNRIEERIKGGVIAPDDEAEEDDEGALGTSIPGFPP